jgi:hypothetical protein
MMFPQAEADAALARTGCWSAQPANRDMMHAKQLGNRTAAFSGGHSTTRFYLLVLGELWPSPHPHAAHARCRPACVRSLQYTLTLVLGERW